MMIRFAVAGASALFVVAGARGAAQSAMLTGTVFRDSAGHQLAAAEVLLPDLNRRATANWAGEFRIVQIPAGRHAVVIRHVGFAPLVDTIEVANGANVDREFVLVEQPTRLDPVSVKAPEKKYISPALQDFEERRKAGSGHFIVEEEMRKNNERRLIDVIQGHLPGISTFTVKTGGSIMKEYISSGRKCGSGPVLLSCAHGPAQCPVTMYLDGVIIYDASRDPPDQMPDLSRYNTRDYAAVEYYAGGASTPIKYNATSSGCGVLLLWTRER
jgi:hypothetical protein